MAITIPSSRIFSIQNEKVINNQIRKVFAEETDVQKQDREFQNFSLSPFREESAKVLFSQYVKYSQNWYFNQQDVSLGSTKTINGIPYQGIRFDIKSDTIIDIQSVIVNLSVNYRYGESYKEMSATRPAFYSNNNLSDIESANATLYFSNSYSPRETLLYSSSYPNIPAAYANAVINTAKKRSKSFEITVYVPTYYEDQIEGVVDSVVFTNFSISISGKEYNFSEKSRIEYGSGEKTFGLETNEFFQEYKDGQGTFYDGYGGAVSAAQKISQAIIDNYKDGKETAVLRCSIPDNLQVFEIGYEVIPMIYGADGEDTPMSMYRDGTPKIFRVVGSKFIYDGAVWQEIILQEKHKNIEVI